MFNYESMVKRLVSFFPTWSDIRKRYNTSTGGSLLDSITKESLTIEDALEEYKKYFFLGTYEGHEDEVVAFSYMAKVGIVKNINELVLEYNGENIQITENVNYFITHTDKAYYEDGKIYIRDEIYKDNKIYMKTKVSTLSYELEHVHVWNLFDEFACFVNIKRNEGETNSQLVKRIKYRTANKPNASIEGLRNAIIDELLIDCPELATNRKVIKIEKTNADNLNEAYKKFSSLLDFLASMNRDVYRWKKWDIDEWEYDFNSLMYIPIKWDDMITTWQNGIGYDDDLAVIMASDIQDTDASITFYDKSKEVMNRYLTNKNIEKDITFTLKRYNDILNGVKAHYKIKTSEVRELNPNEISLNVFKEVTKADEVNIEEIYSFGSDVEPLTSDSRITNVNPYKLKFEVKDGNYDMEISKAKVTYINNTTKEVVKEQNLLRSKNGFTLNAIGSLVNNSVKQTLRNIESFDNKQVSGFKNCNDGIEATEKVNTAVKTLYNMGGYKVSYKTKCDTSPITESTGFFVPDTTVYKWQDSDIILNPETLNKNIYIKLTANKFSFDVKSNNSVTVYMRYNKDDNYELQGKAEAYSTWSTEETETPRYMEIVIISRATEEITLGNFLYSKYNLLFEYSINDRPYVPLENNTLPMNNSIKLKLTVESYSGSNPTIQGIYVGSDASSIVYITDTIPYMNNCYRLINVSSNCKVSLIKRDINDMLDEDILENFSSAASYKSNSSEAYIRLNLNEYSSIDSVTTKIGSIQQVEESGAIFYNLLIPEGQVATTVEIVGIKKTPEYTTTLLDLVNLKLSGESYVFDTLKDKLYCSRLIEGLLVVKNNDKGKQEIIKLDSSLFAGVNGMRYNFNNIPNGIGAVWYSGDYTNYSFEHAGSFDNISFYPANSIIHTATNSYDLYVDEVKNIPIVSNFTDPGSYNPRHLNFYTIESDTDNLDIRFYSYLEDSIPFDELKTWSLGIRNLYFKNDTDLYNNISYNIKAIEYSDTIKLAEYINLPRKITLSNNNVLNLEQYVIEPPEGMTVQYLKYNGTASTEDLIRTETLYIQGSSFTKLLYSNIDEILYIGTTLEKKDSVSDVKNYNLLKEQGIIVWNEAGEYNTVYIKYTIKRPVALLFDLDTLYKLTGYTVDTYNELNTYVLNNMKNGSTYDLRSYSDYENSDLVYIACSEPSFEGILTNKYTIKFNKHSNNKSLLVKTGYYYINGREYYLFSNDGSLELNVSKHMISENIDIDENKITTYKATNNYVRNSEMLLRGINDIYNFNKERPNIIENAFTTITACDSYNDWSSYCMNIKLTDEFNTLRKENNNQEYYGFNGLAMQFTPDKNPDGYAFIDITNYVSPVSYISFAATKGLKVYIGEEYMYANVKFPRAISIKLKHEIKAEAEVESSIRSQIFNTDPNKNYYIVVKGAGAIDDIIVSDRIYENLNYHSKNIDKIGFNFNEIKTPGTKFEMSIDSNKNCISKGASLCSDHRIKTTSDIDWGISTVKIFETEEDFKQEGCDFLDCEVITDNYIKAPDNSNAIYTTCPIFIKHPANINRLFYKINNIESDDIIRVTMYSSATEEGVYNQVSTFSKYYGVLFGDALNKYIKLKIEISAGSYIDNIGIFAEYKSDGTNTLTAPTPSIGEIISPIFDAQERALYNLNSVNINSMSYKSDVKFYIRSAYNLYNTTKWSEWEEIELDRLFKVSHNKHYAFETNETQLFQFKVKLLSKEAYVDLDNITIEVKK